MNRTPSRLLAVLAFLVLVLASCSGDTQHSANTPVHTPRTTNTAASSSTTTSTPGSSSSQSAASADSSSSSSSATSSSRSRSGDSSAITTGGGSGSNPTAAPPPTPPTPSIAPVTAPQPTTTAPQNQRCLIGCWHTGIKTTFERGGHPAEDGDQGQTNEVSAWYDPKPLWEKYLCGIDNDGSRAIVQAGCDNLFYFALPCSDYDEDGPVWENISLSPWADDSVRDGQSWFKNKWIEVRYHGTSVFVQWEDVGPAGAPGHEVDDCNYVFGAARPQQETRNHTGSALDISPLAFRRLTGDNLDKGEIWTDWRFVSAADVPAGEWLLNPTTRGPDWR